MANVTPITKRGGRKPQRHEVLASWRDRMGYSHRDAAQALGCSRNAFAGWESGRSRVPRYIMLACSALALGIKVEGE